MKSFVVLIAIAALCFSFVAPAFANAPKDKLSRGAANVLSALLEVPKNIDIEWKESNNAAIGIFAGFFKGVGWGLARTISGLWDIVTFPFPLPAEYESAVQPEYIQRGVQTHFLGEQQKVK